MADALASSILHFLLGVELGSNQLSFDGITVGPGADGALAVGIRKLEAASLRLARGPLTLEVGRLGLQDLVAQVSVEDGRPRLRSMEAASVELQDVMAQGPLDFPQPSGAAAAGAWSLGPLATADGTIRAQIVDAHLMFDADVTVPIRYGQIDFGDATVEHVGPDSRMGASHLGIYVDAPNGRSYLYQFPSTPVAGVEFERRGALLGAFVRDRGKLHLQEFAEGLMRQGPANASQGLTAQTRVLLERTAMSGELQLGDGTFAGPGAQAELVGRANGRNTIRLRSEAVGRGISADLASLSVSNVVLKGPAAQLGCDEVAASLMLRVFVEASQLRFACHCTKLKISGLQV